MILEDLKDIVKHGRSQKLNNSYIKNELKEYLQIVVLNYIYNSDYKYLIFTGGSCLRHCYKDFNRLSEDLDFDYVEKPDIKALKTDINKYFRSRLLYDNLDMSIKNRNRQILLKLPILKKLGLASSEESNLLYLKIEFSKNPSKKFGIDLTMGVKGGFTYLIKHYDLSTLMAGKISAILTRKRFVGKKDRETVKGRDYYDLIWFLKKGIKPNMKRLSDLLDIRNESDLKDKLDSKIKVVISSFKDDVKQDLQAVIEDVNFTNSFVDNYKKLYDKYSKNLFIDVKTNWK